VRGAWRTRFTLRPLVSLQKRVRIEGLGSASQPELLAETSAPLRLLLEETCIYGSYTRTHTHTHTHTHTDTRVYIHTHTHTRTAATGA
jgi:hypothetical protein